MWYQIRAARWLTSKWIPWNSFIHLLLVSSRHQTPLLWQRGRKMYSLDLLRITVSLNTIAFKRNFGLVRQEHLKPDSIRFTCGLIQSCIMLVPVTSKAKTLKEPGLGNMRTVQVLRIFESISCSTLIFHLSHSLIKMTLRILQALRRVDSSWKRNLNKTRIHMTFQKLSTQKAKLKKSQLSCQILTTSNMTKP